MFHAPCCADAMTVGGSPRRHGEAQRPSRQRCEQQSAATTHLVSPAWHALGNAHTPPEHDTSQHTPSSSQGSPIALHVGATAASPASPFWSAVRAPHATTTIVCKNASAFAGKAMLEDS